MCKNVLCFCDVNSCRCMIFVLFDIHVYLSASSIILYDNHIYGLLFCGDAHFFVAHQICCTYSHYVLFVMSVFVNCLYLFDRCDHIWNLYQEKICAIQNIFITEQVLISSSHFHNYFIMCVFSHGNHGNHRRSCSQAMSIWRMNLLSYISQISCASDMHDFIYEIKDVFWINFHTFLLKVLLN